MACSSHSLLFFLFFSRIHAPLLRIIIGEEKDRRKRLSSFLSKNAKRKEKDIYIRNLLRYQYLIRNWNSIFSLCMPRVVSLYPRARIVVTNINEIRVGCKGCNVYKRARKKKRKMNLGAFITRNFRASLLPDRIPTVINIGTFIYHYEPYRFGLGY